MSQSKKRTSRPVVTSKLPCTFDNCRVGNHGHTKCKHPHLTSNCKLKIQRSVQDSREITIIFGLVTLQRELLRGNILTLKSWLIKY